MALATAIISLQERDGVPRYDEPDKPDNLMYMGHFGVATNDDTWKRHFMGISKQGQIWEIQNKVSLLVWACI